MGRVLCNILKYIHVVSLSIYVCTMYVCVGQHGNVHQGNMGMYIRALCEIVHYRSLQSKFHSVCTISYVTKMVIQHFYSG